MTTVVTALFDNADMAELALRQLRGHNIPLYSFYIQPSRQDHVQRDALPVPVALAPAFQNTVGAFYAPPLMPMALTPPPVRETAEAHDVIFTATIPGEDADRVRGMLISAHGRKVR